MSLQCDSFDSTTIVQLWRVFLSHSMATQQCDQFLINSGFNFRSSRRNYWCGICDAKTRQLPMVFIEAEIIHIARMELELC